MAASDSEKDQEESAPEDSDTEEKAADSDDEDEGESDADAIDEVLAAEESAAAADDDDEEEDEEEEKVEEKSSNSKGGNSGRAPAKLPGVDMETGPPPATKKTPPSKPSRPIVTSGILDMRKLAAAYERELGAATAARADTDEEPPMLGSADLSGPQVMLPTAEPTRSDNRAMLMVLGAILAVVLIGITALVTVFLVRHFSKGDDKGPAVAQASPVPGQPANAGGGQPVAPTPGGGDDTGDDEEPIVDDDTGDETQPAGDIKPPADKRDPKRDDKRDPKRDDRRDVPKDDGEKDPPVVPTDDGKKDPPVVPKDDGKKNPPKDDGKKDDGKAEACDEYVCLIEPDKPCCKKQAGKKADGDKPKPAEPSLPERPSSADIQKGFATLRPKLQGCADKHDFRGTANVKLQISPSGSVTGASTSAGTGVFQNCVESQAKRVTFAESQKGTSATFALVSR